MQTVIVIKHGDEEILVRVFDQHIDYFDIAVDSRPRNTMRSETWHPVDPADVEVRHEGS